MDWQMSSSLAILMNTRGLMELIVLNVGLDLGVISPDALHDAGDDGDRDDHGDDAGAEAGDAGSGARAC